MGRLRNLSASFKAAAFPSTSSSPHSHRRPSPASPDRLHENKEDPAIVHEDSANSSPGSSSAVRPTSMVYTPPTIVSAANEEIEELKPVFSYLSSHANKLYQEGYFLKLDDLDSSGKPNPNRIWTECFAQLVGTVLSFWNAEALDAAGQDGEVAPSFINLADASIKMIETLPTRNQDVQPLQNVLSVSTAGKNRYLLHFNSLHSLTQWTAGIRLAMFENASLQELYTGSLVAGKGRHLNGVNQIMTKNRFRVEDWARVRFGAGTPWRRCWCVIEPPDEKEWQKSQKRIGKRSAYDKVIYPKGDIKFYDTKKIKKAHPIATITDAYSAYAIYPQSKPLINESTLVKLEGKITIHSQPESKTEGFVFVMPEVHPAVSGFEIMLRWLVPVFDTFALYGRPTRLIPDTLDPRSLMFAMPKERRYGYLDIIDVAALIHTDGSERWSEREWRKRLKEAVVRRMSMQAPGRASNVERLRNVANPHQGVQYSDRASIHSNHSAHRRNESSDADFEIPKKTHTTSALASSRYHARSVSENTSLSPKKMREPGMRDYNPSRLSEEHAPPEQLQYNPPVPHQRLPLQPRVNNAGYVDSANSSDSESQGRVYAEDVERDMIQQKSVQPVAAPPEFQHQANEQPRQRPRDRPELRREKSRMSDATLAQMNPRALEELRRESDARDAGQGGFAYNDTATSAATHAWQSQSQNQNRGVIETPADASGTLANQQRPAVVTYPSSTSLHSSIKRKPLSSTSNLAVDDQRPPLARNPSNLSYTSMNDHGRDSSPDYASRPSEEHPIEKEKVRGGTRKIIGNADPGEAVESSNIHVDFGQTLRLTPEGSQPSTNRTGAAGGRKSPFDVLGHPESAGGRRSPFSSLGLPSNGRKSPLNPLATPEKQNTSDRPAHSRSQSYAWRPRSQVENESPEGLSADEFVQQRAVAATKQQNYVPYRSTSSGRVDQIKSDEQPRASTPTSPRKLQKRMSSSRNSISSVDFTAHLSAREQEHVARMTGGPLLSNVNQQNRTPDPSVGLIGAIEARDQEKQNIKKGWQGQMVQAAIDQRTRELQTHHMQQTQSHDRRHSQYMMQQAQQQYQNPSPYQYPVASDHASQSMLQNYQAHLNPTPQQQYPQSEQGMYTLQQYGQPSQLPAPRQSSGYSPQNAPSTHQRSPSSYSQQYGGFYAPR